MEKREYKLIDGTHGTWEMWRDEIVPIGERLQFLLCGSYAFHGFGDAYEGGRETLQFVVDKKNRYVGEKLYFPADVAARIVRIALCGWREATGSPEVFDECCPQDSSLEQRFSLLLGSGYKMQAWPGGEAPFVLERSGSQLYITREVAAWLTRVASMGWESAIRPDSQFEADFQEDLGRTANRGELDGIHEDLSTLNGRLDGQGTKIRALRSALCGVVKREEYRWAVRAMWGIPNIFLPGSPRSQRTLGAKAYEQYPFNHIALEDTRKYASEASKGSRGSN